jgi:hypothetical protein
MTGQNLGGGDDIWHTVGAAGEPAYQNTFAASFRPLQFSRDSRGLVQLRGLIQTPNPAPTVGSAIFTLPVGYRAGLSMGFVVSTNSSDTVVRSLRLSTDGSVIMGNNVAWPTGEFIDVSPVIFRAEG